MENFLEGEEASYFIIVDKNNFKFLEPHKIIKELAKTTKVQILADGAYSPAPIIDKILEKNNKEDHISDTICFKREKTF